MSRPTPTPPFGPAPATIHETALLIDADRHAGGCPETCARHRFVARIHPSGTSYLVRVTP